MYKFTKFTAAYRIKHKVTRNITTLPLDGRLLHCQLPTPPPQEEFHQLSLTGFFKSHHGDLTSKAFFFAKSNPSMTRRGCRP